MAKLTFKTEYCKGCGLCVLACPKNILAISNTDSNKNGYFLAYCTDNDKCIGCAACAKMCPDCVIEVDR